MKYLIESSVAVPEFRGRAWNTVYPFASMAVGESILVEHGKSESVVRAAQGFAKRHRGWKFTCRKDGGGMRVWCVQKPAKCDELPLRLVNRLGNW